MRLLIAFLLVMFSTNTLASGSKTFNWDIQKFGTGAGVRALYFDKIPDGSTAILSVDPANEEFVLNNKVNVSAGLDVTGALDVTTSANIGTLLDVIGASDLQGGLTVSGGLTDITGDTTVTGDLVVNGKHEVISTTKASIPCPKMTEAEMLALAVKVDGDCVYDTTNHKQMTYDSNAAKFIEGGGVGGSRLSLLEDGSFESGVAEGACTVCIASQETSTVINSPYNEASLKLAFAGVVGNYTMDKVTGTEWANVAGKVSCQIKTDQANVKFCARDSGTDTECIDVYGDNDWHEYIIPTIIGSTSHGYKVDATTTFTGNVFVDECKVEQNESTFSIAQTEYLFNVNIGGANILLSNGNVTSYIGIFSSTLDMIINKGSNLEIPCTSTNPSTGLTCAVGSEGIGVVFDADRVGDYEICLYGSEQRSHANYQSSATFQLVETANNSQVILQEGGARVSTFSGNQQSGGNGGSLVNCSMFNFQTAGQKTIRLMYEQSVSGTLTSQPTLLADRNTSIGGRDVQITGKYYPPTSKVVAQQQILNDDSTNEFNFVMSYAAGWSVDTEDLSTPIASFSAQGAGSFTALFRAGLFTVAPLVNCEQHSNSAEAVAFSITPSGFSFQGYNFSGGGTATSPISCTVKKQGVDFNKSAIVIGRFKENETKCQTKYLSTAKTSTGIMSELTFNNLKVGRQYNIGGKIALSDNTGGAAQVNTTVFFVNNSVNVGSQAARINLSSGTASAFNVFSGVNTTFTAGASTLEFNVVTCTACEVVANGGPTGTHIRMCELPTSFVETTEF